MPGPAVPVTSHIDIPGLMGWIEFGFPTPVRFEAAGGLVTSPEVAPPVTVPGQPYIAAAGQLRAWMDEAAEEFGYGPDGYPAQWTLETKRQPSGVMETSIEMGAFEHGAEWDPATEEVTFHRTAMNVPWGEFQFWAVNLWRWAQILKRLSV